MDKNTNKTGSLTPNDLDKIEGIDNISKELATKKRVDKLEKWAHEVGEKVGVRLETQT